MDPGASLGRYAKALMTVCYVCTDWNACDDCAALQRWQRVYTCTTALDHASPAGAAQLTAGLSFAQPNQVVIAPEAPPCWRALDGHWHRNPADDTGWRTHRESPGLVCETQPSHQSRQYGKCGRSGSDDFFACLACLAHLATLLVSPSNQRPRQH